MDVRPWDSPLRSDDLYLIAFSVAAIAAGFAAAYGILRNWFYQPSQHRWRKLVYLGLLLAWCGFLLLYRVSVRGSADGPVVAEILLLVAGVSLVIGGVAYPIAAIAWQRRWAMALTISAAVIACGYCVVAARMGAF